ncbi:MAG: hypothetical protein EOO13_04980 [Chitinophagaceae bacterium]|nr:MAG: hypothetical protein EOO13_04980 [Chitinophagaceae bacterium]
MKKVTKIVLLLSILNGFMLTTWADRGGVGKKKAKVSLNIVDVNSPKSLSFNLKTGLKYKGSLLNGNTAAGKSTVLYNNLVTYQKGNTIYIIPNKQKVVVSEMKQGYTGMKLILKPKS